MLKFYKVATAIGWYQSCS